MPQIREYSQRTSAPGPIQGPRVSGEALGAGMARELARAGAAVQEFGDTMYKAEENRETTEATVQLSKAHAEFTNQLNKQLQEGTINSEEFMQQYDERMGEISGNYATVGAQNHFNRGAANLRSNFLVSATSAQAEIAGTKAIIGYQESQKNLSSGIMNDPSSFKVAMQLQSDYLDTLVSQGLPATKAAQLKVQMQTELAKSAVRGWTNLNPEDAKAQLNQGLWDEMFDGDVKKQMLGEVDTAINAKRIEQERMRAEAEKAKVEQQKVTQNTFLSKMVKGQLSTKEILNSNLEAFGSGSKEQFLRMVEEDAKAPIKTDSATFTSLFERIHLPDGDPKKILDENELNQYVIKRQLTMEDLNRLRSEIQGKNTQAGDIESRMRNQLLEVGKQRLVKSNPMLGIKDPEGELQYAKYLQYVQDEFETQRKAGKSARQLLDPNSTDYIGHGLSNFAKTPTQIMKSMTNSMKPQTAIDPAKARKPGETPAEYMKRMKDGNK